MALAVTAIQKGNVKSCRWSLLTTIFFGFAVRTALRPLPVATGASLLVGAIGVAKTDVIAWLPPGSWM